jgi:hypothetical protein
MSCSGGRLCLSVCACSGVSQLRIIARYRSTTGRSVDEVALIRDTKKPLRAYVYRTFVNPNSSAGVQKMGCWQEAPALTSSTNITGTVLSHSQDRPGHARVNTCTHAGPGSWEHHPHRRVDLR